MIRGAVEVAMHFLLSTVPKKHSRKLLAGRLTPAGKVIVKTVVAEYPVGITMLKSNSPDSPALMISGTF